MCVAPPQACEDACRNPNYCVLLSLRLEKIRVVNMADGERNYHVFYQLCLSSWASEFSLEAPEQYAYLNKSSCFTVDDVDDNHEFEIMLQASALHTTQAFKHQQPYTYTHAPSTQRAFKHQPRSHIHTRPSSSSHAHSNTNRHTPAGLQRPRVQH